MQATNPHSLGFKKRDSLDIDDVLFKIEKSFNIRFGDTELQHLNTFGELCEVVVNKIDLPNVEDCTLQQAFYKIRNVIVLMDSITKNDITPDTKLEDIFLKKDRRQKVDQFEKNLDIKMNLLQPKEWIMLTIITLLVLSIAVLFYQWKIGVIMFVGMVVSINISKKQGRELSVNTVGELAKKLTREKYILIRRNPQTVNKKEIVQNIKAIFSHELAIEEDLLTGDATFV